MITGSIVALVTPMKADGSLDWAGLDSLVKWHLDEGTHGIVPVGTTGESATVTVAEHCQIIERVVGVVAGQVPVIAGTGANATAEAIELTAAAKKAAADACLLVTPYYNKPTQEGLFLHYCAVAAAVDIPQILYNVPGRTACDMQAETVVRLAGIPNIVGIKEATGDVQRTVDILAGVEDDFAVYSGDDATAVELMLNGAKGTISVTANVAPKQMANVCELAVGGDREKAGAANAPLLALHERLFLESNPIPVKWALHSMGRIDEGIRLPLTTLSEVHQGPLRDALKQAGVSS